MVIQTEVTLQPDCVMGGILALQKLLFYRFPSVPDGRSLRKFSILVMLTFCPQGGVTSCY